MFVIVKVENGIKTPVTDPIENEEEARNLCWFKNDESLYAPYRFQVDEVISPE